MSREIHHSLLIIVAFGLAFLLSATTFAAYDLQISAVLLAALYGGKRFVFPRHSHRLFESLIYVFIITLIVVTTGGLQSPFFFLFYFLLFALSLFLEPIISVTATITCILLFLFSVPGNVQDIKQLLPLLSLAIITPFALFLGREFAENLTLQKTITQNKESSLLFLSLVIKNHIKAIVEATENYTGDHHLEVIRTNAKRMESLITEYEQTS